ncbi:MAG: hypothetical protein ACR2NA_09510 [Solirubrobacterales bacterium]
MEGGTAPGGPRVTATERREAERMLKRDRPGSLYPAVRWFSWAETAVFAGLLVAWLVPGLEAAEMVFGWGHGVGYLALLALLFVAVIRHEVPFWLFLATATPLGPVGSVLGLAVLDRRRAARAPSAA